MTNLYDESLTLDPPGSISIVGGGPLGIEAALYGRFLGYDVKLFESVELGHSLVGRRENPVPMLPDRCVSPLAVSALTAQLGGDLPLQFPTTIDQWIDDWIQRIAATDLLRGRVVVPGKVTAIDQIPVELEEGDEADEGDLPADFRLTFLDGENTEQTHECEAVIVAVGSAQSIALGFDLPAEYFYRIGQQVQSTEELTLWQGLHDVVKIYATFAGRAGLDLYRPTMDS